MLLQYLEMAGKSSASFARDSCTIQPANHSPKGKWLEMLPQRKRLFPNAC